MMQNAFFLRAISRILIWQSAASGSGPVIFFPVDGCWIRKLAFEEGPGKKGDIRERDVECVST